MSKKSLIKEWEYHIISKHCTVRRGASPRPIGNPDYFGGNIGWIRIADVTSANKYLRKTIDYLSPLGESKSVRVYPGDLIMSICGTIGKPIILDMDACIHDGFVQFIKIQNLDIEYFYYLLQKLEYYFSTRGQPGTQVNLNTNIVGTTKIPVPPLAEQKKIAAILSSVDKVIEKTESLINKLKDLKKAMMQELLTKGIGHTKFKNSPLGKIPEEWEVVNMQDLAEVIGGGTPDRSNPKFWNGNISWITPSEVVNNNQIYVNRTKEYITLKGLKCSSAKLHPPGTVLMTSRASIGFTAINTIPMATNQGFQSLRCKDRLFNLYMYYLLQQLKPKLISFAVGTTFLEIPNNEIKKWKIEIPPLTEQKKIATVLIKIHNIIKQKQIFLSKIQNLKTALMQDLLTGKVRVKE